MKRNIEEEKIKWKKYWDDKKKWKKYWDDKKKIKKGENVFVSEDIFTGKKKI